MAKDNSQGAGVQYKVLLKPTDVGLLVMRRMERPHLDKSAELRRLIELGYAAEQAGFILDGTVLRHAGRVWDLQPDLERDRTMLTAQRVPAVPSAAHATASPAHVDADGSSAIADRQPAPDSAAVEPNADGVAQVQPAGGVSLMTNLRGLSGG